MRPICGISSIAGRYFARIRAALIDSRWMSSASRRSFAACTLSAPNPFTTRTPPTVSSTTVARSACSACTARTAGWIASENRRPATFTSGSGARATSASSGSVTNRITATARIIAAFDNVMGIITTKFWIWLRSLDDRLISWPVCARSW